MKKTFIFLIGIILLLASCSSDDNYTDNSTTPISNKIRWYGMQLPQEAQTRGVANGAKLWDQGANISIKFLNLPSDRSLVDSLKLTALEWEKYANIHFDFVRGDQDADVRIAFNWMSNDWLTWSYTGTDAKSITNQRVPTAVFGGLEYLNSKQVKGDMLRLLGQVLGLEYEQRHQLWAQNGYWKDESQLQVYWENQFKRYYGLQWDEIRDYVFTPMTNDNSDLYATKEIDGQSIMAWPYYNADQSNVLIANYDLSAEDKVFVSQLYPKDKQTLPTIQEAWIDAGYFKWTNSLKNQLIITELGAKQEYLPDVSDGEQLTKGVGLFSYKDSFGYIGSNLKTVPQLNMSNITDFSYMFANCRSITTIPELSTSKGTNFNSMFLLCKTLTTLPKLDTSKGTDFGSMFSECDLLTEIPLFDTSNGLNFEGMFNICISLTKIPLLNTSKGTNFSSMFSMSSSLTNIPNLDTSEGITFDKMFSACYSLKSIPLLNTSKGTSFYNTFGECISLRNIPLLDTSKGTNLEGMFNNCKNLVSIPLLNTYKATNLGRMFYNCYSLEYVPQLDVSNGIDFSWMFAQCNKLKSVARLNTSQGTNLSYMFYGCKSLISKPQLDLSNASYNSAIFNGTPFANDPL